MTSSVFSSRAALLALLCMLSALVLAAPDAPPAARPALKLSPQDLAVASRAPLAERLSFTGALQALRATTLAARTEGVAVEVSVREGEAVRAGQVLARLEAADLQERVNEQAALVGKRAVSLGRVAELLRRLAGRFQSSTSSPARAPWPSGPRPCRRAPRRN